MLAACSKYDHFQIWIIKVLVNRGSDNRGSTVDTLAESHVPKSKDIPTTVNVRHGIHGVWVSSILLQVCLYFLCVSCR